MTMTQAQRAKTIKELNDAISLRNHIYILVNGPRTTLISKDEERQLRSFASQLDREVVEKSLEMVIVPETPKLVVKKTHKAMTQANAIKAEEKVRPKGSFRRVSE
ncbi:hypothetical protein LCGC14_0427150 [marine sediment metagenome]|uniref:Uncharacterized protein n=1 Tax=marine sediment metagenome TaxID=412755 RepID=A0A0F9VYN4_9ZZZZ